MAAFQIESGVCNGRGFAAGDANGFLAKFYTWVTKTPAGGGPGWTILRDESGTPVVQVVAVDYTVDEFYLTSHGYVT